MISIKKTVFLQIVAALLIISSVCYAQPTITSFTPASGPVGTIVTVTGTNFDTTPSNNIVFFGATQATVTDASATALTVNVPTGATYQPVTVLVNGLLAYSAVPFVVTFAGSGLVNSNSFATKADYSVGQLAQTVAIGDFDGDGKADLAITNFNDNTVSILRNTSISTGTISYAAEVNISTGARPYAVVTGDFDGDGKVDLAVTNSHLTSGNTVSVFRNTSIGVGNISYANRVNFTTGTAPFFVATGDFDGDGKADLVVTNETSNTVSVFRNTSSGAGNIAYATKVDFTTGTQPYSVAIGDLDNDGKVDLAIANLASNTVSVFRNTSSGTGNISYTAKVDFTTGVGSEPISVAIGDLDGDGKADLATANKTNNKVSLFRNTSTGAGTIDYAAKVDLTTGTQPYSVAIGVLDGDNKLDLAVANLSSGSISVFRNTGTSSGTISFATKVDFTTGTFPFSVALGDLDGDGQTDLAAVNYGSQTTSVLKHVSSATDILTFSLPEQARAATIDSANHTIDIELLEGTNVTSLSPTITLSIGAAVSPLSGVAQDFTNPIVYTVTAEDLVTVQDWTINAYETLPTFTDVRDGNTYKYVDIGNQTWMAENLAYLPNVIHPSNESAVAPFYYVYLYYGTTDNLVSAMANANYSTYGVLYNWTAAMGGSGSSTTNPSGVQGVCPSGWHLPSNAEWDELIAEIGGATEGGKLKETGTAHWLSPNGGATDEFLFSSLPGGRKVAGGLFSSATSNGYLWSSTESSAADAGVKMQDKDYSDIIDLGIAKEAGHSVRCLEDINTETDIIDFSFVEESGPATIDNVNHLVDIEVVFGTSLTSLTPTIALSTDATVSPLSGVAQDFSSFFIYTVTAEDGITTQNWTVLVSEAPNTATDITSFTLAEQTGAATIDLVNHTVGIEVAYGTDVTALTPTIALSTNATVSPVSGVAQDFTNPVVYTVTAEDGTTIQAWTVTVTTALNAATDITTFSFTEQTAAITPDAVNHIIDIEVAFGTVVTGLTPTITVSSGATISPLTGVAQDFTNSVTYTVTAEDGITTQNWTVLVSEAPNTATDITSFTLAEQTGAATIDLVNHTVGIEVAFGTVVTGLTPTITLSSGATISPLTGVPQDFTNSVTYTVTAEDGITTQNWMVTVIPALPKVTSIEPPSSIPGKEVIIFGANFDQIPTNNIVAFGGINATVSIATSNTLTATVPFGVIGPIEVEVTANGQTSNSPTNFTVLDSLRGGALGTQQIITTMADDVEAILAADLDGDGDLDVISASSADNSIRWFENTDSQGTFGSAQLVSGVASVVEHIIAADMDGDGDLDLITPNKGDNEIVWYQNIDGFGTFGIKQVISNLAIGPTAVAAADIDGDGLVDVLSASSTDDKIAWYRNTDGLGSFGAQKVITTLADQASSLFTADIDGDNDVDVISTSNADDKLAWYENTDGLGNFGVQQVISTTGDRANWVIGSDIDGDGDIDLISASNLDDKIAWYENTDGAGTFGTEQIITGLADFVITIDVTDLDGDGDMDVLSASSNDNIIAWYENTNGTGTFGPKQVISTLHDFAFYLTSGDLDNDGDNDVIAGSFNDNMLAWYENLNVQTDILSFSLSEATGPATIDAINHTVDIEVAQGTDLAMLIASFTLSAGASAEIGGVPQISGTTVNGFSTPNFLTYTITAEDGITTQDWVVTVTVVALSSSTEITAFSFAEQTGAATIDNGGFGIVVEVANGTDLTTLVATFTLPTGASAQINSIDQVSGTTASDFTNSVTYTITAEDGTTTQNWTVTVTEALLTSTDITAFTFPDQADVAIIDAVNHTVDIAVDFGISLTNLIADFTLSPGATASIPITVTTQVSGITGNDFSGSVSYLITAGDGVTTQEWIVTVGIAPNTTTDIEQYSIPNQVGATIYNTGALSVTVIVPAATNLTNLIATFTFSEGATATIDGTTQFSGITANDFTNALTYLLTAQDGISQEPWTVTVANEAVLGLPSIDFVTQPSSTFEMGGGDVTISVTATDAEGITGVIMYNSPIRSIESPWSSQAATNSTGDTWTANITDSMLDDIGVAFVFEAADGSGNTVATDTVYVYKSFSMAGSPAIPSANLGQGGTAADWRMFSIPYDLDNAQISSLFESDLGTYDKSKWRLIRYNASSDNFTEYKTGLSSIELGKGYWFNSVEQASINIGVAQTTQVTSSQLATIPLDNGWTQIGNPYPFSITWSDVIGHNSSTAGNLKVFNGGTTLADAALLNAFEAAYVFSDGTDLQVPFTSGSGSRIKEAPKTLDNDWWELPIEIKSGNFVNKIGKIGMSPTASSSKDQFDAMRVPRFAQYADLTFSHPEFFYPWFSGDIVPTAETQTWDFVVESNIGESNLLTWDNLNFGDNSQELYLEDVTTGQIVSMRRFSEYEYASSNKRSFKIHFGPQDKIFSLIGGKTAKLGLAYPNPFQDKTTIYFTLPSNEVNLNAAVVIYDGMGKKIHEFGSMKLNGGLHFVEWNSQASLPSGLYVIKLFVNGKTGNNLSQRIIKQ